MLTLAVAALRPLLKSDALPTPSGWHAPALVGLRGCVPGGANDGRRAAAYHGLALVPDADDGVMVPMRAVALKISRRMVWARR